MVVAPPLQAFAGVSPATAWRLEHGQAKQRDHDEVDAVRARRKLSGVVGALIPEWGPVFELDGVRHRQRLEAVRLGDATVLLGGRSLPAEWQEEVAGSSGAMWREALAVCSSAYVVGALGGKVATAPMKCGKAWCPTCVRWQAGARVRTWMPLLQRLLALGFRAETWTLTRPNDLPTETEDPSLPAWRRGMQGFCRPVTGESLVEAEDVVRTAFRRVREGDRDLWRGVAGYLYGMEGTGRSPATGRRRWHVHLHVFVLYPPGEPSIWADVREAWCRIVGGAERAQHCEVLQGDRVEKAVSECLKYPFKAGDLNAAQWAEVIAARGIRHHQAGGIFHGGTVHGRAMRRAVSGEGEPGWYQLARDAWSGRELPPEWVPILVTVERQTRTLVEALLSEVTEDGDEDHVEWEPLTWGRIRLEVERGRSGCLVYLRGAPGHGAWTWGQLERSCQMTDSVVDSSDDLACSSG